jgi:hypothetical protein
MNHLKNRAELKAFFRPSGRDLTLDREKAARHFRSSASSDQRTGIVSPNQDETRTLRQTGPVGKSHTRMVGRQTSDFTCVARLAADIELTSKVTLH